ncbi:hypothetical protein SORBI_3002G018800 [Sorghum bicolor]|jgi:hypothetical protein|uniref:Uncharacterized protein n=1 Tax=Sorghum bicolor TaxID=4558 RepID=C5X835_SORBI|nr:hypothetical protein SORBI_3002G018800 [Sorghum bicolor]
MADMLSSAVVQETVSQILSNLEEKYKEGSDTKEHMERLEMAHIRLEAALEVSQRWNISSAPLLRWRSKLERTVQECGETLHRCKRHVREEEEVEEGVRNSSLPNRMAHQVKSFVSSILSNNSSGSRELSISNVRRFEWFAEGASEFLRFVELGGGTPRQLMFFDPLVTHLFAGKMIRYKLMLGSQCHLAILQPIITPHGMEGRLLYVVIDGDAPENSFFFTIFLRISESTDIVGVAVRCLQLFAPHFKTTTEAVKTKLTQLPMQDLCWFPYVESSQKQRHWEKFYTIFSQWFRPNPHCCRAGCSRRQLLDDEHRQCMNPSAGTGGVGGSHTSSSSSLPMTGGDHMYLEPVVQVCLQSHVPLSAAGGYNRNRSLFPYVKLRLLFSPHSSSEGVLLPSSVGGSATDTLVQGRQESSDGGGGLYANISFEELDEILLPKAIQCLRRGQNGVYQMVWRSAHGGAYIQAEKYTPRRSSRKGSRRGGHRRRPQRQDDKVETWSHVVTDFLGRWAAHAPPRLQPSISDWTREEKEMQLAATRVV